MQLAHLLAFALSLATSEAAHKGFNYGATKADGSVKSQSDFESEFSTAKGLVGTAGFTSARLYTMIQGGTTNSPISAIPAAIAENTSLLLGLWASGGGMDNELAALKAAISQYGDSFAKLVVGISVGSEDLYRASSEGEKVDAGVGVGPEALVSYIKEVRSIISGTALSSVPIGHVDTWTAWTNGSNSAVIDAVDWLGFDGYPYYQSSMSNSISDAKALFDSSVAQTKAVANGKEVWITETGWPVSGSTQNLAVASLANAKTYWDEVGCPLFDETNTWWYILQDASSSTTPNPSFGVVGGTLSTTPLFNLTCSNTTRPSPSASSSAASSTILSGSAVASGSAIATANPSSSGVVPGATPSTTPGFTVGKGFRPSNSSAAAHYSSASFTGSAYPKFTKTASGSSSTSTSAGSSSDSTSTNSGSSSDSKSTNSGSSSSGSTSVLATGGASSVSSSVFGALVAVLAFAATL